MKDAFNTAVDMFFDSDYMFLHLQKGDGSFMSLKDLLKEAANTDSDVDTRLLKRHIINEAREWWNKRNYNAVEIPDNIVYNGHVYSVFEVEGQEEVEIDFNSMSIITAPDDENNTVLKESFIIALIKIVLHHEEISIKKSHIEAIGKGVFKLLRMNSCFIAD